MSRFVYTTSMDVDELKKIAQKIVEEANNLKNKHTGERKAPVNYACVFSQSPEEYEALLAAASKLGSVVKETPPGPLFRIEPLQTVSGPLQLLKVRAPDKTRPERGDADFTVADYPACKKASLERLGFKLIEREEFEMIELMDPAFDVRVYFSHPPLDQQLGLV